MQRQLALAETRAQQAQDALGALQTDAATTPRARRNVTFKPTLTAADQEGQALRSALAGLQRQGNVIDDAIDADSQAGRGLSAETQALLDGYQAQGAALQSQVDQYKGKPGISLEVLEFRIVMTWMRLPLPLLLPTLVWCCCRLGSWTLGQPPSLARPSGGAGRARAAAASQGQCLTALGIRLNHRSDTCVLPRRQSVERWKLTLGL